MNPASMVEADSPDLASIRRCAKSMLEAETLLERLPGEKNEGRRRKHERTVERADHVSRPMNYATLLSGARNCEP